MRTFLFLFVLTLSLATLSACASANSNGGGATPLINASTCGTNRLCMTKQALSSMKIQTPGFHDGQDGVSYVGCYPVPGPLALARSTADNRARSDLKSILDKPTVQEFYKGKMVFTAKALEGTEAVDHGIVQLGKGFLICSKLVQRNLTALGGGN